MTWWIFSLKNVWRNLIQTFFIHSAFVRVFFVFEIIQSKKSEGARNIWYISEISIAEGLAALQHGGNLYTSLDYSFWDPEFALNVYLWLIYNSYNNSDYFSASQIFVSIEQSSHDTAQKVQNSLLIEFGLLPALNLGFITNCTILNIILKIIINMKLKFNEAKQMHVPIKSMYEHSNYFSYFNI